MEKKVLEELDLQHKITIPFAETGDKFNIPDNSPTGLVNNTDGFGFKYETPIADGGEYFERQQLNAIFYTVYAAVKELQDIAITAGFPIDMTKALNVLDIPNGGTNANNAQDAANNILKDVAVNTTLNNTDYVYIFADNAVKKITLTNLVNKIIPIGFIYIQYRNQSTPDILFGTDGKWQDISSTYAGEFFRAVGGNSASFGSKQNEGLPNITGILNNYIGSPVSESGALYKTGFGKTYFQGQSAETNYQTISLGINASKSNSIYGSSTHVTPYNSAIRVWKKIK